MKLLPQKESPVILCIQSFMEIFVIFDSATVIRKFTNKKNFLHVFVVEGLFLA